MSVQSLPADVTPPLPELTDGSYRRTLPTVLTLPELTDGKFPDGRFPDRRPPTEGPRRDLSPDPIIPKTYVQDGPKATQFRGFE